MVVPGGGDGGGGRCGRPGWFVSRLDWRHLDKRSVCVEGAWSRAQGGWVGEYVRSVVADAIDRHTNANRTDIICVCLGISEKQSE